MKLKRYQYCLVLYAFLFTWTFLNGYSQTVVKTTIKGSVVDAKTGEILPFISVFLQNTTIGTVTDYAGNYSLETTVNAGTIVFSSLGYTSESRPLSIGKTQIINIKLKPATYSIDEVVVRPPRRNYSNKNNPAVELIDKVIAKKSENRKEGSDYLQYDKYEKIQFALANFSQRFKEHGLLRKFQFIFDNIDTTKQEGKEILPMFIKETLSRCYYRKNPVGNKEIIHGEKTINFDEYIDNKGVSANLRYLYQNINIYDNDVMFMTNKFLSPIANGAPLFYRYFIIDTLLVDNVNCFKLLFEPRNRSDFLFEGYLYVTQDSSYAIKKVDMGLNNHINVDWIKDVKIVQDFAQVQKKSWMLSKDEISMNFGITKNSLGLFGQRTVSYADYAINEIIADTVFRGQAIISKLDPLEKNTDYWEKNRLQPLTKTEKGVYTLVDSIKQIPAFKRRMDVIMLLTTEFLTFKKIEIGPVGNFYSFNPIEGSRVRFGGRTTPGFSKKITFDSYLAYGFTDNKLKYSAGVTYSFTPRTIYQFPVTSLKLSYQYDTKIPGQEFQFAQGDNILLSFTRGVNDKLLYNKTFKAEFYDEFENHFSYDLGYNFTKQAPAGTLFFNPFDYVSNVVPDINISEIFVNLRYAPNEGFYQGKLYRYPVSNKYPIILFKYALGSKLIGNDYTYSRVQANIFQRIFFPLIGYTDIIGEAGKIFGHVPYPLLFIHRANQTFSYQMDSYNLMNFLEFVSDKYVLVSIDHCFNGFLFNKFPLLKRFKLRELVTFKALYGGVSNINNPNTNKDLFKFPVDIIGTPLTYSLERKPYIEAGIGVSNIFRIFRVDLIKRFTYTGNPNVSTIGLRVQFRLDI
jgi:Family of unknown function (DUF5686)/CarboxypepD_reg-like domain